MSKGRKRIMIVANNKELKKAFYNHFSSYKSFSEQQIFPKRLSLFYAVECGLKVLLIEKINGRSTKDLQQHQVYNTVVQGVRGHDIQYLAKQVNYPPITLQPIKCATGDFAHPQMYNQVWRYNIKADEPSQIIIEKQLEDIANWIRGII